MTFLSRFIMKRPSYKVITLAALIGWYYAYKQLRIWQPSFVRNTLWTPFINITYPKLLIMFVSNIPLISIESQLPPISIHKGRIL